MNRQKILNVSKFFCSRSELFLPRSGHFLKAAGSRSEPAAGRPTERKNNVLAGWKTDTQP